MNTAQAGLCRCRPLNTGPSLLLAQGRGQGRACSRAVTVQQQEEPSESGTESEESREAGDGDGGGGGDASAAYTQPRRSGRPHVAPRPIYTPEVRAQRWDPILWGAAPSRGWIGSWPQERRSRPTIRASFFPQANRLGSGRLQAPGVQCCHPTLC